MRIMPIKTENQSSTLLGHCAREKLFLKVMPLHHRTCFSVGIRGEWQISIWRNTVWLRRRSRNNSTWRNRDGNVKYYWTMLAWIWIVFQPEVEQSPDAHWAEATAKHRRERSPHSRFEKRKKERKSSIDWLNLRHRFTWGHARASLRRPPCGEEWHLHTSKS